MYIYFKFLNTITGGDSTLKSFLKIIKYFLVLIVITLTSCFLYVKFSPKPVINSANNITLYDTNNNMFFKGNEKKEWVSLDDISNYLINATIYTEDKNFYKHFGFDFLRIGKALVTNIARKNNNQGASTITQQYAKNLFLNFDKTWKRKWDEAWYTIKIEANYSKKEILEGYLNTINYGHGEYGIENAAKFYFNKNSKDLDLAEATMLAGIPKAPSIYSPIIDMNAAKERQMIVLNSLVNNGIITNKEKNKAFNEKLNIVGNDEENIYTSINYYKDAVMDELKKINSIPSNYSELKGLKIYTNFNYDVQTNLESNIKDTFPEDSEIETASVVMNPDNGGIMALIGGRDYNKSAYNRATESNRQVGSTMKPYLYYAALENGFTASTAFTSEATTFPLDNGKSYSPINYNNKYGNKAISMATAIAYSDNIYAVKTHMFLGYDALINVAKRVGITAELEAVPSLPLGTNEINIIEMASGYGAFASGGYKLKGHLIEKVVDGKGGVLYTYNDSKDLVLNSSLVFILNNLLTATYDPAYVDYNYPTGIGLNGKLNHTYALKSGTTATDNWNIGFNKKIICAVWVGYDKNKELSSKDYKYAQNIWYKTVENYEKDMKNDDVWYDKPKNITGMLVEPISGKPATNNDKKQKLVYFLKGTEPKETDSTFDEITG